MQITRRHETRETRSLAQRLVRAHRTGERGQSVIALAVILLIVISTIAALRLAYQPSANDAAANADPSGSQTPAAGDPTHRVADGSDQLKSGDQLAAASDSDRDIDSEDASSQPAANKVVETVAVDAAAVEHVKRSIPNLDRVSVEEGTRILQELAQEEFVGLVKEMEVQLKDIQGDLAGSRGAQQPDTKREAALKQVREIESKHADKLKDVTVQLQARIAALRQLKNEVQ